MLHTQLTFPCTSIKDAELDAASRSHVHGSAGFQELLSQQATVVSILDNSVKQCPVPLRCPSQTSSCVSGWCTSECAAHAMQCMMMLQKKLACGPIMMLCNKIISQLNHLSS